MPSLSELSVISGIPTHKLKFLGKFGLQYYEDEFETDRHHQKALNDLSYKRLTPYVIAYILYWREGSRFEQRDRSDSIVSIAKARDLPILADLAFIRSKQISDDRLPTAQHWIDRAAGEKVDTAALERLGHWAFTVICNGSDGNELLYSYLAVRLLLSIPYEDMPKYSRPIQRALNRVKFHGHLDGCHRVGPGLDGKNMTFFFRPKFDL